MRGGGLATAVGVGSALAGLAVLLVPGVTPGFAPAEFMTLALGVGALGVGLYVARDAIRRGPSGPPLPSPETPPSRTVPGDDLDAQIATLHPFTRFDAGGSDALLRERLEHGAVRTLQRRRGCSPERARELVRNGAWTDDPVAAAFLQPGVATPSPRGSPITSFVAFVRSESARPEQARRVIAAIRALAEEEG